VEDGYGFSPAPAGCQLDAPPSGSYNRSMSFDPLDPPGPLAIVRGFFLGAMAVVAIGIVVAAGASGTIPWRGLGLLGGLWTLWVFSAQVYEVAIEPLGRFLHRQLFTGSVITLDDEIADLEARLARPGLPRRREILASIRLAEIYRERLYDKPRADALLDRLLVKYPDSSELRIARRLPP